MTTTTKTLADLKVGDEVCNNAHALHRKFWKVAKIGKEQITIDDGQRFYIKNGREVSQFSSRTFRPASEADHEEQAAANETHRAEAKEAETRRAAREASRRKWLEARLAEIVEAHRDTDPSAIDLLRQACEQWSNLE